MIVCEHVTAIHPNLKRRPVVCQGGMIKYVFFCSNTNVVNLSSNCLTSPMHLAPVDSSAIRLSRLVLCCQGNRAP